ncbi:MAG: hypothetical protein JWO67_3179 [Streptosporangiaceae bacterium]|nr:hypothetical protein [Streptosporangiaceae bacterium]
MTEAAQLITAVASMVGALTGVFALALTSHRVLKREKKGAAERTVELHATDPEDLRELLEIAEQIRHVTEHHGDEHSSPNAGGA